MGLEQVTSKKLFAGITIHKILETNCSFNMKQRTAGKNQFVFFSNFLLILTKFSFWGGSGGGGGGGGGEGKLVTRL